MTRAQQRARANVWSKPFRGSRRQHWQTQSEGHLRATRDFFAQGVFFLYKKPRKNGTGVLAPKHTHKKVKRENRGRERACTSNCAVCRKSREASPENAQNTPYMASLPVCSPPHLVAFLKM
jgi:hypothetical protein